MSVPTKLALLATAMQNYTTSLVIAIGRKMDVAATTLNALRIGTKNQADLTADAAAILNPHLAAINPHNDTLESINAYSTATILGKLGDKVLQGILPISKFRVGTDIVITNTSGVWSMTITDLLLVISGRYLKVPGESIVEIDPLINGTTYYLYGILEAGFVNLTISLTPLNESDGVFYISTFIKNASASQSLPHGTLGGTTGIVRLATVRRTTTAAGQAIPVSTSTNILVWK